MQPFNDVTLSNWNWENFKLENIVKDLKNRTDQLKTECDLMESTSNSITGKINNITASLGIIYTQIADLQTTLNAVLLKETSIITEEELKVIYKMLTSPDKENKVVAQEAIYNKLKEL